MDGQAIISGQPKSYARPWTGCIAFDQLTADNLPPFYVRLQDEQVGHLALWVGDQVDHLASLKTVNQASITPTKLGQYWPWDFDLSGMISPRRDSWVAECVGNPKMREQGLGGGKEVPLWTDPGLPLTYTSSHKIMTAELDAIKTRAAPKREAEYEAVQNVPMPVKRPRCGSMSAELQKMKEAAAMKRRSTETEQGCYPSGIPELQHVMQIVDAQMRSATEAQNQNAALETMVLANEAQYIKDMGERFNEWRAYNHAQRTEEHAQWTEVRARWTEARARWIEARARWTEAHTLSKHCIATMKTHGIKIKTLDAEVKASKTLIEKQSQKLRVRDAHLATTRKRWAQQRAFLETKCKVIQEIARDVHEQSRVDFGSSVLSDEGSDYGAESKEKENEVDETGIDQQLKPMPEQTQEPNEPQEPKRAPTPTSTSDSRIEPDVPSQRTPPPTSLSDLSVHHCTPDEPTTSHIQENMSSTKVDSGYREPKREASNSKQGPKTRGRKPRSELSERGSRGTRSTVLSQKT